MRIGYARVSTDEQNTNLQTDALKAAGCDKVYIDKGISGVVTARPQLDKCLKALQPGDVLVVWKLDRLGRSLGHLIEVVKDLQARQVGFHSLKDAIDTTTPQGMLVFHIMGALGQFERELIKERTAAGRVAAVKRGVRFGRPAKLSSQQVKHVQTLKQEGKSVPDIAGLVGVSRYTVYRTLNRAA